MTNPNQLRSEEVQEILTAVPHWMISWGSTIIFCIMLGVISLTWVIRYPETVQGEAVFTTEKEPAYLFSKVSGNLTGLYVKENDIVKKGQLLAEIYNPIQKDQINYLQKKLKEVDQLLIGQISEILFETNEPTFGDFQQHYNQLKSNVNDFIQLQSQYYQESALHLKNNINKYNLLSKIYTDKLTIAQRELNNAELKFNMDQELFNSAVITKLDIINRESDLNQKRMEVESFKQSLIQNDLSIADLRKSLQEQLFNQTESIRKVKASILSEKKILENYIQSWMQSYAITTPIDGRIAFIEKVSVGLHILPSKAILVIIPDNQEVLVKVKVPSEGYGKIHLGQKVRFNLDNYPNHEYGFLYGLVDKKSPLPNEKMYELIVKLPNSLVSSYGHEITYKPNMIAKAEVIVDNQRILENLFYTLRKSLKI